MNIRGALARASALLGPKATVDRRRCSHFKEKPGRIPGCTGMGSHPQPCPGGLPLFVVGRLEMGLFNVVKGEGFTWEEALERAAGAVHEDRCRKCLRRLQCRDGARLRMSAEAYRDRAIRDLGLWWSIREPWVPAPAPSKGKAT